MTSIDSGVCRYPYWSFGFASARSHFGNHRKELTELTPDTTTDVTAIGLGAMGSALAGAFLEAGFRTSVWNRSPERAEPLIDRGATFRPSITESIAASPLIVTCLSTYGATTDVFDRPDVRASLTGRTLVNAASGTPGEAERFRAFVESCGAGYLEAKLLSFPVHIGAEDTVIYFSGDRKLYDEHQPVLAALAGQGTYLAAQIGAAATMYQAYWTYYYSALFGYMEVAAFIQRAGLSVEDLLPHARRATSDVLWHLEDVTRRVTSGDYSGDQAELITYLDGFDSMQDTLRHVGVDSEILKAAVTLTRDASEAGFARNDVASIVEYLTTVKG